MAKSNTYKTSYGLEYKLLTPAQWKKTRNTLQNPYDKSIGDMHIANSGYAIMDTQYNTPIDNEYDLGDIYNQIDEMKKRNVSSAKVKSTALGGQG